MTENKSWCPIPWKSVSIRNNGDFRVCCHSNTSTTRGILKDEKGVAYNAKDAQISDVRNSPLLNEIRAAMLKGVRHSACVRCNMEDDSGVRSRRQYETDIWRDSFGPAEAVTVTREGGRIGAEEPIEFYDLRFGNLCNLKCRMCGPTDSSLWHKEYYEMSGPFFYDTPGKVHLEKVDGVVAVKGENPYDWHRNPDFWRQIEGRVKDIRRIHTVGGEPLLIDRHYELLRRIIDAGHAKDVVMDYTSNITIIPQRALDLWKEFKEVRLGASVDGYGRINDYIRHPSKWERIEKNLDLLDSAEGNLNVWITATVQIYSVYYLTDFLKWKILKGFKRINSSARLPFLTTHPLHTPSYLSIKALPAPVKQMVSEKFDDFYQNWFLPHVHGADFPADLRENWIAKMQSLLGGYRDLMWKEDLSALLPKFWAEMKSMDTYRKENFFAVMPEIAYPIRDALKKQGHEVA